MITRKTAAAWVRVSPSRLPSTPLRQRHDTEPQQLPADLELAGRFPPDADIAAAWAAIVGIFGRHAT